VVVLLVAIGSRGMPARMVLPLLGVTLLGVGLFAFAVFVDRDLFSPASLVGLIVLSFYVARPIYIFSAKSWGAGASADLMDLDPLATGYLIRSLRVAFLATACAFVAYAVSRIAVGTRVSRRPIPPVHLRAGRARRAVLVSVGLTALLFLVLLQRAGGPSGYLNALAHKSSFLQGSYYATFLRLPLKACLFAWAATIFSKPGERIRRRDRQVLGALLFGVMASDFLTGGRATLLVQTLLPVALLYHYARRPIRPRSFVALLLCGMAIFVSVRVVTRDSQFNAGQGIGLTTQLKESVLRFPATTVGGTDAVPFDSLMTLMAHEEDAPLGGRTYAEAINAPIPRALFPWKSDGGGNTWFTKTYYPRFYYPDHIETSVSLYGEAYANWRLPGIVIVASLFGAGLGLVYSQFRRRSSPRWLLGYVAGIGTFALMLRGDAYQTTTSLLAVIVVSCLSVRLVRRGDPLDAADRVR